MKKEAPVCRAVRVGTVGSLVSFALATALIPLSAGQAAGSSPIQLQSTLPGTPQTGNANITGTFVAGSFQGDGSLLTHILWSALIGVPVTFPPGGPAGGDLTGSYPNPLVGGLQGYAVSSIAPTTGQVLKWDGTAWMPGVDNNTSYGAGAGLSLLNSIFSVAVGGISTPMLADGAVTDAKIISIDYSKITNAPNSLPPSGPAGGDLVGSSYPNPVIANGVVTSGKLADGAVSTGKLADGAVTDAKVASVGWSKITGAPTSFAASGPAGGDLAGTYPNPTVGGLQGRPVSNTAPTTDGQVLRWNGTTMQWEPGSGTTYSAGTGLSLLNSIFSVAVGGISTAMLADGAVTNAKIASVDYSKITNAPSSLPPSGAASGDLTGNYPGPTITANTVNSGKLSSDAASLNKVSGGVMNSDGTDVGIGGLPQAGARLFVSGRGQFANSVSVNGNGVFTGQVTANSFAGNGGQLTGVTPQGAAGGDLAGSNYPSPIIASNAVNHAKLLLDPASLAQVSGGVMTSNGTSISIVGVGSPLLTINGDATITGTLTSGVKDFKIDHPQDPANKYLYHSCVESNEQANVYSGNITTDQNGEAEVLLPSYVEALNRDFRYQLTVLGQFAQAIVATEVQNNRFTIKTDKPNVKVSWQVTGVRQDAYALAHPLQVEVDKQGEERGKYLHPELYGMPPAAGIRHQSQR